MDKNQRNIKRQIERRKRQRRIKSKPRLRYIRYLLILLFTLLIFLVFYLLFLKDKTLNDKDVKDLSVENTINENDAEVSKINDLSEILKNPGKELNIRVKNYLVNNNLDEKSVSYFFKSLNIENNFEFNNSKIPFGNMENMVLALIIEDLANKKNIDLNQKFEQTNSSKTDISTVRDLMEDMLIFDNKSAVDILSGLVIPYTKYEWRAYAIEKMALEIDNNQNISLNSLKKIGEILLSKVDGKYLYQNTINILIKNAGSIRELKNIYNKNVFGYKYDKKTNLEYGFFLGKSDSFFAIYSNKPDDANLITDVREIIYEWKNQFKY